MHTGVVSRGKRGIWCRRRPLAWQLRNWCRRTWLDSAVLFGAVRQLAHTAQCHAAVTSLSLSSHEVMHLCLSAPFAFFLWSTSSRSSIGLASYLAGLRRSEPARSQSLYGLFSVSPIINQTMPGCTRRDHCIGAPLQPKLDALAGGKGAPTVWFQDRPRRQRARRTQEAREGRGHQAALASFHERRLHRRWVTAAQPSQGEDGGLCHPGGLTAHVSPLGRPRAARGLDGHAANRNPWPLCPSRRRRATLKIKPKTCGAEGRSWASSKRTRVP